MSEVKYSFFSWVRQGLTQGITTKEIYTGSEPSDGTDVRASVGLKLDIKRYQPDSSETHAIDKTISLAGPEDVVGINPNAIIKVTPPAFSQDFEPNYLASIEFYEEDFPWRFTPAVADDSATEMNSKLRPWISLLVLKTNEYENNRLLSSGLYGITIPQATLPKLSSPDETWAWAHTQVNKETTVADLDGDIETDPNIGYARILSPRRLEANKKYTAFLVPTFEVGRQSGFGETVSGNKMVHSWDPAGSADLNMPYYYSWDFETAGTGDFESLARQLKPKYVPYNFGETEIDVQKPNHSAIDAKFNTPTGSIAMKGALLPVESIEEQYDITDSINDNFINGLKGILNDSVARLDEDKTDSSEVNESNPLGDPVITPPIYGQYATLRNSMEDDTTENWINRANLDPRYRTIAGYGASVVREHQEEFMSLAWKQVDSVIEANKKINAVYLAKTASNTVFRNNLVNVTNETSIVLSNAAHGRVKINSNSLKKSIMDSPIPDGIMENSFRKDSRQGTAFAAHSPDNLLNNSVALLNSGSLTLSSSYPAATGMSQMQFVSTDSYSCAAVSNVNPSSNLVVVAPGVNPPATVLGPMSVSGQNMVAGICTIDPNAVGGAVAIPANAIDLVAIASSVRAQLNPEQSVVNRALKTITFKDASGAITHPTTLKPIQAAPDINISLGARLSNLYKDIFTPNLDLLPNNSVSLLNTNQKFVEAFMLGANHEFSRELFWREYPTDKRGTYFKSFWDSIDKNETDIKNIHQWGNDDLLGGNSARTAELSNQLVLAVRGDLLRKYPNCRIMLNKARWEDPSDSNVPRKIDENIEAIEPVFYSKVDPDIYFVGFNISYEDAVGDNDDRFSSITDPNPGYFFVFKEVIGETRFGMDIGDYATNTGGGGTNTPSGIENLNWGHMQEDAVEVIYNVKLNKLTGNFGLNSANVAFALNQDPVKIAIHASELFKD